jgi:hypothetical protein
MMRSPQRLGHRAYPFASLESASAQLNASAGMQAAIVRGERACMEERHWITHWVTGVDRVRYIRRGLRQPVVGMSTCK